jgi:hypothetical protein
VRRRKKGLGKMAKGKKKVKPNESFVLLTKEQALEKEITFIPSENRRRLLVG